MTIGLALSGGGFRAALFNLGSLYRLNDFGLLPRLSRITSVSGGSITSALLGLRWKQLKFNDSQVATNFEDLVGAPIKEFCGRLIDIPCALAGILNPFSSTSEMVACLYRKYLYGDATLQDLPGDDGPRFIIYATNLQTGASFRFSRPYLADYKLGQLLNPVVSLAAAVAASSAFPPFLSPAVLTTKAADWKQVPGAYLYARQELREKVYLVDGGVYDNMGFEAIWNDVDIPLMSDAGAPLEIQQYPSLNWLGQTTRVIDLISDQVRAVRTRWLIEGFQDRKGQDCVIAGRKGTFWSIKTRIADYQLPDPMTQDSLQTAYLSTIRTRLAPFYGWEKGELINWAYALADAAIRRYCPQLGQARGRWPVKEHAL